MKTKSCEAEGLGGSLCSAGPIWREIASCSERDNPGAEKSWAVGGSRTLTLTCGHEIRQKQSQTVPKKCRCKECESLRRQKTGSIWPTLGIQEVWNEEKQMPETVPWSEPNDDMSRREATPPQK